ncbi:alpha/beta hydrolase family protein [Pigmentiphaga litoralis]|uniref:Dipeptidyl aminopeptidase/acylaminoacyl peptidase n=1 Tax=Pigmentiphaga litoralis TaxID=516702 RepID=A0A7Y9LLG3_9BURK|nr:alpha/beta fold hydrolase [Pigmentiphaga litoralis]NYE23854.1 dipeptidyl aminopeptidase/acylaminoacyl peptidase [Pigmentiphaga litoralis]NYE82532.1 dipeptidyl aminopeptidase/acylaminoacyl peptidase [Pigmentiphaga litoralis]
MSHWFEYFPKNHMWSQGMMFGIEMAAWGAAAIGEIDQIGQKLRGHEGDNELWWTEWTAMAQRIEGFGDIEEAQGHRLTSGAYYLRAAIYYFCGERFIAPSERKWDTYRSCLRCFTKGVERRYPQIERVDVPYEDTTLPAWFLKADVKGPAPTVVMFDGLDNAKEMSVLFGGVEIARRGIHVLAIDGPGQGEALRLQGIPSRYDYEVPAGAAYDHITQRPEVDPERVAVMGFSMGGYYAPRAAAMDPRFAACVAWGGHFDYHESWQRRRKIMESGGTKLSAPGFQLPWVLGMPDIDACMKKLENYRLDGIAEKMRCPFFCIHGEDDNIVQLDFAERLYAAVGSADKTLKVLRAYDGGSEHCQEDNRQVGANIVADWLADHL